MGSGLQPAIRRRSYRADCDSQRRRSRSVPAVPGAELLTRRFGIVATGPCAEVRPAPTSSKGGVSSSPAPCQAEVQQEFKKLIDSTESPDHPPVPAYVAGFFMNQTSVDIL